MPGIGRLDFNIEILTISSWRQDFNIGFLASGLTKPFTSGFRYWDHVVRIAEQFCLTINVEHSGNIAVFGSDAFGHCSIVCMLF